MAIGKLQEILKQLDAINPEEFKQSMKSDSSPELAECLQSARQKLKEYLDIIIKAIEGDYRTAPRLPEYTQGAIVPVEQPTLAVPNQNELAAEHDALEKLKILEEIKCSEYKQLLKEKFGRISAASMRLLQKMDKIFAGLEVIKDFEPKESEPKCSINIQASILKIIGFLIDNIQEAPAGKADSGPQAKMLRPYVKYLLRELSFFGPSWLYTPLYTPNGRVKALPATMKFLEFLTLLFRDNNSKIFDLQCSERGWLEPAKCPLPLLLAGNFDYWGKNINWGNQKEAIDKTKEILLKKLMIMLPKFQGMQRWLETVISGHERLKQLFELMWVLTPEELEKLAPDSCQRFFAFLGKADALKRFKSCSQKERVDFILAGEYTFSALGNALSKNNSSPTLS